MINDFLSAMAEHRPELELMAFLERLERYARFHVQTEESILRYHEYPDLFSHRSEHRLFVEWATGLVRDYQNGRGLPVDIMSALHAWLARHILTSDKGYLEYFRSTGVLQSSLHAPARPQLQSPA